MFSKYFTDLTKQFKKKPATKKTASKTTKSKTAKKPVAQKVDMKKVVENISKIVPFGLRVEQSRVIDKSGFSPDGVDIVIYEPYCEDIVKLMGGYVPYELAKGLIYVVPTLDKKTLVELLLQISAAKKLNTFSNESEDLTVEQIPTFIIAMNSKYDMLEIKNDIMNYYMAKGEDISRQFEVMLLMDKGIVAKNWREKTYTAIESLDDSFSWFFIMMNEYIEESRNEKIDFREYVKKSVVYAQY